MQDFSLEGVGKINGGEYHNLNVGGVGTCTGDLKVDDIRVEGVLNCSGSLEAGYFSCEGVADFKSDIRAKKIDIEGVLNSKGGKIEADEIYCEGVIKARGEISAEVLRAEGCINASEIVGDRIIISYYRTWSNFIRLFRKERSHINMIEATSIELSGVTADTVNGKDIVIGPDCIINNLDCSGTLSIDKSSVVKNITGTYTRA
jgi:cytoskeletal protein CcmA (bactofilin family)